MRRTGTPAQPKFHSQLAWLKRLAALAGPLRERRPGRVGPLANVFPQGMSRAGWRARGSQIKVRERPSTRDLVLPECAECHTTVGTKPGREGTYLGPESSTAIGATRMEATMNGLIYLVGLVVVIMFILSFLGLR
jgi:hypothetical protein